MNKTKKEVDEKKTVVHRKKNPMVLVGGLATVAVLCAGLYAFNKGDVVMSQRMMRARVAAQGITVLIMVGTSGYFGLYNKQ